MPFLTKGKTNWKYILIVFVLAVIVGGGILGWQWWMAKEEIKMPEIKVPEEVTVDEQKLAEDTVKGYVNALMSRSRDNVLPYLTGEAKEKVQKRPPFFGISNPHLGSFEILSSKKLDTNEFEFIVREYDEYTGYGIIGYNDETLIVTKVGKKYLISSTKTGEYVDIKETADWKTYRNEELGFEVKYPQQWTFKEQKMPAKGVTFGEEKKVEPPTVKGAIEESVFTPIVAFNFYSNVCEIEGNVPCRPLEEYLNWFASLIKSVKKEEATVEPIVFGANNYKGFALKEGGDVTGIYYQQKEAILEAFKVSAELKYNGNIFNQMLSTFTLY